MYRRIHEEMMQNQRYFFNPIWPYVEGEHRKNCDLCLNFVFKCHSVSEISYNEQGINFVRYSPCPSQEYNNCCKTFYRLDCVVQWIDLTAKPPTCCWNHFKLERKSRNSQFCLNNLQAPCTFDCTDSVLASFQIDSIYTKDARHPRCQYCGSQTRYKTCDAQNDYEISKVIAIHYSGVKYFEVEFTNDEELYRKINEIKEDAIIFYYNRHNALLRKIYIKK